MFNFNKEKKKILIFSSILFVLSFLFGYFIMDGRSEERRVGKV